MTPPQTEIERLASLYTNQLLYNLHYYTRNKEALYQLLLEFAAEIKRSET